MDPVEIEFLVNDNARMQADEVADGIASITRQAGIAQQYIKDLEAQISYLEAAIERVTDPDKCQKLLQQLGLLRENLERIASITPSLQLSMDSSAGKVNASQFALRRSEVEAEYGRQLEQIASWQRDTQLALKAMNPGDKELAIQSQVINDSANRQARKAQKIRNTELEKVDREESGVDSASLAGLLDKYATYEEQREALTSQYDSEISALTANPEKKELAEQAKQKALEELDVAYAQQFVDFEVWTNWITELSLSKLQQMLTESREKLAQMEKDPDADTNQLVKTRAEVSSLSKLTEKMEADEALRVDENSQKSWEKTKDSIEQVGDQLEEIGGVIDETLGGIFELANSLASSVVTMIDSIGAISKMSKEELLSLEGASAILTAISVGIKIVSTIANLFKGGETSEERNIRLAKEFNKELLTMKERARINSDVFDSIFGNREYARFAQNAEVAREAFERMEALKRQMIASPDVLHTYEGAGASQNGPYSDITTQGGGLSDAAEQARQYSETWGSFEDTLANMQVQTRHSTWFRSAKYQSLGSLLPELFNEDGSVSMEALKKFVEEGDSTFQHLSKENQEMLRQMVEDWDMYQEAMSAVRDYLEGIFGDMGATLTDAMVSAFENGTDAADTFLESVEDALRRLAKDMIYSATLGPVIEKAQQQIEQISQSDASDTEKFEQMADVLDTMVSEALEQQETGRLLWEELSRSAEEKGLSIADPEGIQQSARAGAIEGVSQESASRIEGLMTSLQIHMASLDDSFDQTLPLLGGSLNALNKITQNTDNLPLILGLLDELKRNGIKVR